MTKHEKLTKALEKLCADFENSHYKKDERDQHPEWEEWVNKACESLNGIIAFSPICPPRCGPPD